MAVSATPPVIKSEPDVTKLNGFTGRTTQVSKYLQARGGTGQMIVPPSEMPVNEILRLMTTLPIAHGPGFYKFSVADTGGTGDEVWMTRLGPPEQENSMALNGLPTGSTPGAAGAPLSEGVRVIGRGFTYDSELGVLTTPWGTGVNWRPGDQFPTPPTALSGAAATPWNGPGGQNGQGGWGNWPAVDSGPSAREKALEERLAAQDRQREMDKLREDTRRAQEETAKLVAAALEKMTLALTAKPSGPDPEVQRRLDEAERKAEAAERRAEDERRETARREEMRAMNERFERGLREATANKADPMMPMLLQLMQSGQQAATESVKAIQAAAAQTAAASERGVTQLVASMAGNNIGPLQLVSLLQTAKSDSADAAKTIMETAKDALSMQKETLMGLIDATGQGNQPAWVGVASAALDRLGALGAALAERNAQQAQQVQVQQQQQMAQRQQRQPQQFRPMTVPAQPQVGHMNGASGTPALSPTAPIVIPSTPGADRPGRVDTGGRPEGTEYDGTTDEFIMTDGRRIKNSDVAAHGWKAVLTQPNKFKSSAVVDKPTEAPAAFVDQTAPVAPVAAPVTLVSVPTGTAAEKPKRGKKKDEPPAHVPMSIEQLQDQDADELFVVCSKFPDEVFFGATLLPYVKQLRDSRPAPADVAKYVVDAQKRITEAHLPVPLAMDILSALQVEVLAARLFPDGDEYGAAVVEALKSLLGIIDEEDDDEGPVT